METLYQEHRRTHPERYIVGAIRNIVKDAQGRTKNHPCYSCIVDQTMKSHCIKCGKSGLKAPPEQSTLRFLMTKQEQQYSSIMQNILKIQV